MAAEKGMEAITLITTTLEQIIASAFKTPPHGMNYSGRALGSYLYHTYITLLTFVFSACKPNRPNKPLQALSALSVSNQATENEGETLDNVANLLIHDITHKCAGQRFV